MLSDNFGQLLNRLLTGGRLVMSYVTFITIAARNSIDSCRTSGCYFQNRDSQNWPQISPYVVFVSSVRNLFQLDVVCKGFHEATMTLTNLIRPFTDIFKS